MRHALGFVATLGIGLLSPRVGQACDHAMLELEELSQELKLVEKLLKTSPERAFEKALAIDRRVELTQELSDDERRHGRGVQRLARKIIGTAIVRTAGHVNLRRGVSVARGRLSEGQRIKNLRHALALLKQVARQRPGDVSLRARIAEAQAQLPGLAGEALATLRDLKRRDLLVDAHSLRALAELERTRTTSQILAATSR